MLSDHMWSNVGVQLLTENARECLADRIKKSYRAQMLWGVACLVRLLKESEPGIDPLLWDRGLRKGIGIGGGA